MRNNKGLLIVVSGPSGSGKGTVMAQLLKTRDDIFLSVSATTRAPRPGEIDGINYFFVSKERFEEMIKNNEVLEYTEYCGNYYGTPLAAVQNTLSEGKNVILEIEVQGAAQVKQIMPDCLTVFIIPPSFDELEKRLKNRGTESQDAIDRRLKRALDEYEYLNIYDYVVINDQIDRAVNEISNLINIEIKNRKTNDEVIK